MSDLLTEAFWKTASVASTDTKISAGEDINGRDVTGKTPLMWAAQFNDKTNVFNNLLTKGAEHNARDYFGMTPLMWAALGNTNHNVINTLINNGEDPKLKDKYGNTAWDYAQKNSHIKGTKSYWKLNDARF